MKNFIVLISMLFCATLSYAQSATPFDKDIHISFEKYKIVVEPKDYEIYSCDFSILPKGGDLVGPYKVKGELSTSKEVMKAIGHARPGDRVYIEGVLVRDKKTGAMRHAVGTSYEVK